MKYRVIVSSYLEVHADNKVEADREFNALKEALADKSRIPADEERDLMLNAEVVGIALEVDDYSNSTSGTGE